MNNKTNNKDWYKSEGNTKTKFKDAIGCGLILSVIILAVGIPLGIAAVLTLNFDKIQNYFYRDIFFFPISQASGLFGIGALFLSLITSLIIGIIIFSLGFPKSKIKFKDLPKKEQIEEIKSGLFVWGFIAIFFVPSAICCYYAFTSGIFFEKDFLTKRTLFRVENFNYSDIKEVRLEEEDGTGTYSSHTDRIKHDSLTYPTTHTKYSFVTLQNKTITIQEWLSKAVIDIDEDKLPKSISFFESKGISVNINLK